MFDSWKIKAYILLGIIFVIFLGVIYANRTIEKSKQDFNSVNDVIFTDLEEYLKLCIETEKHKCK